VRLGFGAVAWVRRHPLLAAVGFVALVALLLRVLFLFRAPVFVTGDSEGYLVPAYQLARGLGFDLSLKRTPAYPGFVALVIAGWSEDLRALAFAQHALGVATAVLALLLGRLAFGLLVGVGAGLLTAVNGGLLLSEHTVMTEALFVPLLLGAVTALVAALRSRTVALYAVAGLLLGAATLTRPVAQVVALLVPAAILLVERRWRPTILFSLAALGAFGLTLLPWMARSAGEHESVAVGTLGQTLVGRTARHDRGAFTYYDPAVHDADPDGTRRHAREVLQQAANNGSSGKAIHTRLRRDLGLGAAETDRLMRDLAVEAILRRPEYYVQGTIQRFVRLSSGSVERLGAYRNTSDVARERWEDEPTRYLLTPTTPAEERAAPAAARMVALYQPGYLGPALPLLALVGLAVAAARPANRPAVVVGLAAVALLFASAALVGNVARYRFPLDPMLAVLALGGLVGLVQALASRVQRPAVERRVLGRPPTQVGSESPSGS
jgi:4-amino-4-deoxy-L-arabinose transferase-like glycosyltransferase